MTSIAAILASALAFACPPDDMPEPVASLPVSSEDVGEPPAWGSASLWGPSAAVEPSGWRAWSTDGLRGMDVGPDAVYGAHDDLADYSGVDMAPLYFETTSPSYPTQRRDAEPELDDGNPEEGWDEAPAYDSGYDAGVPSADEPCLWSAASLPPA